MMIIFKLIKLNNNFFNQLTMTDSKKTKFMKDLTTIMKTIHSHEDRCWIHNGFIKGPPENITEFKYCTFKGGPDNHWSEKEANGIMQQLKSGAEVVRPKITFEPGEMVRVIDGPFNDFSGVVEEVNYEKSRVRVAVLIFGRSTPVELEFNQIQKA